MSAVRRISQTSLLRSQWDWNGRGGKFRDSGESTDGPAMAIMDKCKLEKDKIVQGMNHDDSNFESNRFA